LRKRKRKRKDSRHQCQAKVGEERGRTPLSSKNLGPGYYPKEGKKEKIASRSLHIRTKDEKKGKRTLTTKTFFLLLYGGVEKLWKRKGAKKTLLPSQ